MYEYSNNAHLVGRLILPKPPLKYMLATVTVGLVYTFSYYKFL